MKVISLTGLPSADSGSLPDSKEIDDGEGDFSSSLMMTNPLDKSSCSLHSSGCGTLTTAPHGEDSSNTYSTVINTTNPRDTVVSPDIRNQHASHTEAATRETTVENMELSVLQEQSNITDAGSMFEEEESGKTKPTTDNPACMEMESNDCVDKLKDNNGNNSTTLREYVVRMGDERTATPATPEVKMDSEITDNSESILPQSTIPSSAMDTTCHGPVLPSEKVSQVDLDESFISDNKSKQKIGTSGMKKISGVMPLQNDVDQNLVVDEDQFRMLALSPSPRDDNLEEGRIDDVRSYNNDSSSPIDVVSFAASDGATMVQESATSISSPGRKKFKRRGSDNLSASSANAADAILRRRDRCYFTIVIPKATHGQQEELDLSEIGTEELDDPDRKRALSDGEDFCANNVENGSVENGSDARSRGQVTDDVSLTPYMASADSKFEMYAVAVDRRQDDKASEIALCSMERPHMRGFHFAWLSMFIAFLMWFSITALLSEIQISLNLTKEEIWTSSVFGTTGTIIMRVIMGPLCDKYGSRLCMSLVLLTSAIPTGLTGLVNSANGLYINRLCVGIAGASFVTCEYWTSSLFIKEIAGTANSLVSGWGNLGGGVSQIMMGSVIFPILKIVFGGDTPEAAEEAWRLAFIFPATLGLLMGSVCWKYSDDCPKGNYIKREKQHLRVPVSAFLSLTSACWEVNTWIFVVQYACCFGVEFAMNNAAPLYFRERFDLSTEASAAVASIFGFLNLFARGMGGFISDVCNARYGMRGRLLWMFLILLLQGCSIIMFGFANSLGGAITVMVVFSLFVQAAEGSVYAIVPYVNPSATGSISGVVGAGGTVGGAVFAVLFREYSWEAAFAIMGATVAASSFLSFFLRIRGFEHTFYFCRPKNANREASDDRSPDTVETNLEHLEPEENLLTHDVDFADL